MTHIAQILLNRYIERMSIRRLGILGIALVLQCLGCSRAPGASSSMLLTGTPGDAQNSLVWTNQQAGAVLGRSTLSGGPYTPVPNCDSGAGTCVDTGLFTGKPYFYVLLASGTNGTPQSNELQLVPRPSSTSARQSRYSILRSQLASNLASFETNWNNRGNTPNFYLWTRDLVASAYMELLFNPPNSANYPIALNYAQTWLTTVFAAQITTGTNPGLEGGIGHIPMQINVNPIAIGATPAPGDIDDPNEDEFATQCLAPLLVDFPMSTFSPSIQNWLTGTGAWSGLGLPAVVTALQYHSIAADNPTDLLNPYYTNITILNATALVVLNLPGNPWANSDAYNQGLSDFKNWITTVSQEFIHEYSSPTYYGVGLQSLVTAYRYGPPVMRSEANWGLNAIWSDIAARVFTPNQIFAGPSSRDYDYMRGLGASDAAPFLEGLYTPNAANVPGLDDQQILLYENGQDPQGYQPGNDSLKYASIATKTVAEIYNPAPSPSSSPSGTPNDLLTYITPNYALGTASANYDPQDKILKLQMASLNSDFGNLTFEPGTSPSPTADPSSSTPGDDPYGYVKTGKPQHLNSNPVIVQDQGAALGLLTLTPSSFKTDVRLATSFLFPSDADTLAVLGEPGNVLNSFGASALHITPIDSSNHRVLDLCQGVINPGSSSQQGMPFAQGEVFGYREGQGCAALQIFSADGVGGYTPTFSLVSDGTGAMTGTNMGRLAICHYAGSSPPSNPTNVKLGFFLQAANCPNGDSDLLALMKSVKGLNITPQLAGSGSSQSWSVSVAPSGGPGELSVSQNTVTGAIISRQVGGKEIVPSAFRINQTDVFQFLLQNQL